jgi:nicotinate-nucleotide adenylyltransferase
MIGILGGTFDPVHYGHIRPARELIDRLPFDEIRFMPSSVPPHRAQPQASTKQRLQMVAMAIEGIQGFTLETCELERGGPSFMVDSLMQIRQGLGKDVSLVLIMGADAFLGLTGWHRWEMLTDHAHILVTQRPDYVMQPEEELAAWLAPRKIEPAQLADSPGGHVAMISQEEVDISSTRIRAMVRKKQDIRGLLPDPVCDYIKEEGLYLVPETEEN